MIVTGQRDSSFLTRHVVFNRLRGNGENYKCIQCEKNSASISAAKTDLDERRERTMSEDEQERKNGAAEEDFMAINRQSQIYTATEDTLFTKTTSALSKTHSLVSISHRKLRIDCLFLCVFKSQLGPTQMNGKCFGKVT